MNADMLTIDDLCAGFEEAAKADEIARNDEKVKTFVSKVQAAFENAYIYYKTSVNVNARSPHTKTFKDWLRNYRNIRNDLTQPYMDWCRGFSTYYDETTKEIYFIINLREVYLNIPSLEIRTRTWSYKDLDRQGDNP